jgi:hypothetical protein
MSLLALQTAFRDEIVAPDDGAAPSSLGMAIYRNAYRGRLLDTLKSRFERTVHWVGEDNFTAAACHYILASPPTSWTLDAYGDAFPDLLAELFAGDTEVAELAWMEWAMQEAFAAPDRPSLDPQDLATAGLSDGDWDRVCFAMAPGFASREVQTNCTDLWSALADGPDNDFITSQGGTAHLLIWRQGLSPHYRITTPDEASALSRLAQGQSLGQIAAAQDPERLGPWFAGWLAEGLFSGFWLADIEVGL